MSEYDLYASFFNFFFVASIFLQISSYDFPYVNHAAMFPS